MSRVGWVGLGLMGSPMAVHLLEAGHEVTVFSRREVSAERALAAGATWAATPRQVAAVSDVVFTMVGFPDDVRGVWRGADGVLAGARPETMLVDMTTSEPSLAVELAAEAADRGCVALDAPVSGGQVGAQAGRLVVMAGGDAAAWERVAPLLDAFARAARRLGGPGAGQHTKLANQIAIAAGMLAVCEALAYARAAGLDPEQVIATLQGGAAESFSMGAYGPKILAEDWAPGFKIDHFVKDLRIALAEADTHGLSLTGTELVASLYERLQSEDAGGDGTQALARLVAPRGT